MVPKEEFDNTVTTSPGSTRSAAAAKTASAIVLITGIWLFFSPWIYGANTHGSSWNGWIVGALLFIFGSIRASRPIATVALSWLNALLGVWIVFSPWIFGYTASTGRFINSLFVGAIVLVAAIVSARASHLIPTAVNRPVTH